MKPRKLKYIAGNGVDLYYPIGGYRRFDSGVIYEIQEYSDALRLLDSGSFEEVVDKSVEDVIVETVIEASDEVVEDVLSPSKVRKNFKENLEKK